MLLLLVESGAEFIGNSTRRTKSISLVDYISFNCLTYTTLFGPPDYTHQDVLMRKLVR